MPAPAQRLVVPPRRGLRRLDAALYVGFSPTKFDQLVDDGRMPRPARVDGCLVWDIRALDAALDALFGTEPNEPSEDPNPWDER